MQHYEVQTLPYASSRATLSEPVQSLARAATACMLMLCVEPEFFQGTRDGIVSAFAEGALWEEFFHGIPVQQVPTSYFLTVLGKRLKYSSCLYDSPTDSLDAAEVAMLGKPRPELLNNEVQKGGIPRLCLCQLHRRLSRRAFSRKPYMNAWADAYVSGSSLVSQQMLC